MAEYIKQKIERGKKSICDSCFHQNVCKGIGNQPCTKCSHYQDAADVSPVVPGRWLHTEIEDDEEWGGTWHKWTCDNCGYSVGHNPNGTNYCPNCGAKMDLEASDGKA